MPRKMAMRKRKHAAAQTTPDPVSAAPACDVDGGSSGTSAELIKKDFPGTFLCDYLSDLPSVLHHIWDDIKKRKVSAQLIKCHNYNYTIEALENRPSFLGCAFKETVVDQQEDALWVDIRGRYIHEALELLMYHLNKCLNTPFEYLFVVVGCHVHGVGKGKLKQAVIDLLDRDETIMKDTEGAIMVIQVAGRKDFDSLGWVAGEKIIYEL